MKSACRSTARRTSWSLIGIAEAMGIRSSYRGGRAPAFALVVHNDDQREHQRQDEIEKPEHQQGGDDIGLGRVRYRAEKDELQDPEAPGGVTHKRDRK